MDDETVESILEGFIMIRVGEALLEVDRSTYPSQGSEGKGRGEPDHRISQVANISNAI